MSTSRNAVPMNTSLHFVLCPSTPDATFNPAYIKYPNPEKHKFIVVVAREKDADQYLCRLSDDNTHILCYPHVRKPIHNQTPVKRFDFIGEPFFISRQPQVYFTMCAERTVDGRSLVGGLAASEGDKSEKKEPIIFVSQSEYIDKIADMFTRQVPWPHRAIFLVNKYVSRDLVISELAGAGKFMEEWQNILTKGTRQQCLQTIQFLSEMLSGMRSKYGFVIPNGNGTTPQTQPKPDQAEPEEQSGQETHDNIRSFLYYLIVTSQESYTDHKTSSGQGEAEGAEGTKINRITTAELADIILSRISALELSFLINPANVRMAKIGNGISDDPTGQLQLKLSADICNFMGRHGNGAVLPYIIAQIEKALGEVKTADQKIAVLPHKPITSLNTTSSVIKSPEHYELVTQQYKSLDSLKANISTLYTIMKNNYTVIRGLSCHIADAESRVTKGLKDGKSGADGVGSGPRSKTEMLILETFGVPSNAIMVSVRNLIIMLSQDILFREIFWEVNLLWKMERTINREKWDPVKEQIKRSEIVIDNERHGIVSEKDKKQANTERLAGLTLIRIKKEELSKVRDALRLQIGLIFRSVIPYHWATGITGNMEEDVSLLAISVRGIGANNIAPVMSPQTAGLFLFCKLIREGEPNAISAALRIPPTSVSTLSLDIHYANISPSQQSSSDSQGSKQASGVQPSDGINKGSSDSATTQTSQGSQNTTTTGGSGDQSGEVQRVLLTNRLPPSIDPYNLSKLLISPDMLRNSAPAFGLDIFEAIKQDLASLILTDVDPITNSLISYITSFLMVTKKRKTVVGENGVMKTEDNKLPPNPKLTFLPLITNSLYICQALDVLESRGFTRTSLYLLAIYMRRLFVPKAFKPGSAMGSPHPPFFAFRDCTLICTSFVNIARLVARLTSRCVFHALTVFANVVDLLIRESAKFRLTLDSCERCREKSNRDELRNLFSFTVVTPDGKDTGCPNASLVYSGVYKSSKPLAGSVSAASSHANVKQDNSISWRAFLVSFVDDYILTTNLECNVVLLALNICLPESRNIGNNTIPRDHPAWHPLSDALNVSSGAGANSPQGAGAGGQQGLVNSKMPLSREDLDMWRTLYTSAIPCMYKKVFTTNTSGGSIANSGGSSGSSSSVGAGSGSSSSAIGMNNDMSAVSNSIACSLSPYFKGYSNIIGIPTPKTYPLLLGLETLLCIPNPLVGRKVSWLLKTYGFTHRWDVIFGSNTALSYAQYNINNAEGIDSRLSGTTPSDDFDLSKLSSSSALMQGSDTQSQQGQQTGNIYIAYMKSVYNNMLKAMNLRIKETNTIYPNKTSSIQFCTSSSSSSSNASQGSSSSSTSPSSSSSIPEIDLSYVSDPLFCLSTFVEAIPTYLPICEFDILCKHSLYGSLFALDKLRDVPNYGITETDKITQKDVSYVTNTVAYILNTYSIKNILMSRGFLYPRYVGPILRLLSSRPSFCNTSSSGSMSQSIGAEDELTSGFLVGTRESLIHSLLNATKSPNLVIPDLLSQGKISVPMIEGYLLRICGSGSGLEYFMNFLQRFKALVETPGALQSDPHLAEFVATCGNTISYQSILSGLSNTLNVPGQRHSLQSPVLDIIVLRHGLNDILCNGLFGTFAILHKDNFYFIPTGVDTVSSAQQRTASSITSHSGPRMVSYGVPIGYSHGSGDGDSSSCDTSLNVGKHYSSPSRPVIAPELTEATIAVLERRGRGDIISAWLSAALTMYAFTSGVYIPSQPLIKDAPRAGPADSNNVRPMGLQELFPHYSNSVAMTMFGCVMALQRMHDFSARPIADAVKNNPSARNVVAAVQLPKDPRIQTQLLTELMRLNDALSLKQVDGAAVKAKPIISGFLTYSSRKVSNKKLFWVVQGSSMYAFKDAKDGVCRAVVVLPGARFVDEGILKRPKGQTLGFSVEQASQFDENGDGLIHFECENIQATWSNVLRDYIVSLICPVTPSYSR